MCSFWAVLGECEKNPSYMALQCAPACGSCEALRFDYRCPLPPNLSETDVWKAGDLDKTFQRIISTPDFEKYGLTVLSGPKELVKDEKVPDGPWVLTLDNFLSEPSILFWLAVIPLTQGWFNRSCAVIRLSSS